MKINMIKKLVSIAHSIKFILCFSIFMFVSILFLTLTESCSYLTHSIASRAAATFPGCYYFADTDEKIIALTIDDGPDSITTPDILSVLDQYKAKATFFLISDHITGNEDLVSQMVKQGHELGHHMTKGETTIRLPYDDFRKKFDQADSVLSQYDKIRWFRPGSAWYSKRMIAYLTHGEYDYRCALGSVYPFDPLIPSTIFATVFISKNIKSGSVVVLHDRDSRGKRTAKILRQILPKLQDRGYKFVTLTELYNSCSKPWSDQEIPN
jgi:peptidoglycan/xylan/chitin deacetylase (PgdA/CDA1 family)